MSYSPNTKWIVLSLCTLTTIIVYAIPTLMIPVLFDEMADDLNLDIIQLGIVWGSISLSSMIVGLFGGAVGDRFGSQRTVGYACLLIGILGALRGLAPSYAILVITFFLYGLIAPSFPPNMHKAAAHFFPNNRGISTGAISLGFAFGLFIGSRYTATWLSPLIGGWRNVLFLFGFFGIIFAVLWLLAIPKGALPGPTNTDRPFFRAIFDSLQHVLKVRDMWIVGLASALFWACYRGFTGYVPLYLRGIGWDAGAADRALSNFFLASLILAMPLVFWAERAGNRKPFLITAMAMIGGGVLIFGIGDEQWIPIGIIIAGFMFDAFMAIHQAEVLDMKGIGSYAGTALGALVMFREAGGFLGPPIGNWLVQFDPSLPFLFWGGAGLAAAVVFFFIPPTPKRALINDHSSSA